MKLRVLTGGILHNGEELKKYGVYDLDEKTANSLISVGGIVTTEDVDGEVLPEPQPKEPVKEEVTHYVAVAKPTRELTPEEKAEADKLPVVEPGKTEPDPEEVVVAPADAATTGTGNVATEPAKTQVDEQTQNSAVTSNSADLAPASEKGVGQAEE